MPRNIAQIRPYMMFTDKRGILTRSAYDFLFGLFQRVGGSLDSLNAATLQDKSWEEPGTIGSTTPTTGKFTTVETTAALRVGGGVTPNGSGLKHARVPITVPASSSALATAPWANAFADANYTVTAAVYDATASATACLSVTHIETIGTGSVVVRVENTSAGSLTGTVHVIAMHD